MQLQSQCCVLQVVSGMEGPVTACPTSSSPSSPSALVGCTASGTRCPEVWGVGGEERGGEDREGRGGKQVTTCLYRFTTYTV